MLDVSATFTLPLPDDPKKWDGKNADVYEYYADASVEENTGVVTTDMKAFKVDKNVRTPFSIASTPMLETILCGTQAQCRPKSEGGILPNNHETERTPKTATAGCAEGKYLYYGWEDRPGGDRDFDDIRFVVGCPKRVMVSDKQVRIVR